MHRLVSTLVSAAILALFFVLCTSTASAFGHGALASQGTRLGRDQLPDPPSSSEIKSSIDTALHWIRAQQSEDGSYGDALGTALALEVLATSPRKYRPVDGPYFAKALKVLLGSWNGRHFAYESSDPLNEARVNRHATVVLELVDAKTYAGHITGARAHYDSKGLPPESYPTPHDLGMRAAALLQVQDESGAWPAGNPKLLPTLNIVRVLNQAFGYAKRAESNLAASRTATPLPPLAPATRDELQKSVLRGVSFLLDQQDPEGRWGFDGRPDPGITAMVVGAVLALPEESRTDKLRAKVDKALDWLRSLQDEEGAIHAGQLKNYVTSASVMALAKRGDEADQAAIARARTFLTDLQADEGEGYSSEDLYYGGVGYGGDERPDLSNMQMALEALNAAGTQPGDDTFQKALAFLQRCQNNSETNDLELVRDGVTIGSGNDGGAGYAPGESKAGFVELSDGTQVPRSYGSMTYALLKCYLFAGVAKDDARVEAAWKWISKNYTLDVNPGFEASSDPTAAYQGLFYYFYTMGKALELYGAPTVTDAAGTEHDWRTELGGRLVAMQRQDGSWVNTNAARWFEGNPILATAYALVTLDSVLSGSAEETAK